MKHDVVHSFEEQLRYEANLPLGWVPWSGTEDVLQRELRVKRCLGVLAAQSAFDDMRSEPGDENVSFVPELGRLDAKLNHLIDLVAVLLSSSMPLPQAVPVSFNAWGVAWQSAEAIPPPEATLMVRIHLDANAALPLDMPARAMAPLANGNGTIWQRAVFLDTAESVREGLERLVFRMHRKKLAEERSAGR